MSDSLHARFSTDAGRDAWDRTFADLLRAQRFDEAETRLLAALGDRSSPIARAARAATQVRIEGWAEVDADLEWMTVKRNVPIRAVGLDLSNYNDAPGADWHDKEPAVEFSVYTDRPFAFSAASVEQILAASETERSPWRGEMAGVPEATLSITGLRALNSALLASANDHPWRPSRTDRGPAPDEYVAAAIGEWILHLRFHEAVVRHVTERGLALLVPVLVAAHDVGPWVNAVVVPARVSDHRATTDRLVRERSQRYRAEYDAATEAFVAELDELRRGLQDLRGAHQTRLATVAELRESLLLRLVGLKPAKPSWKMSDVEFQAFARSYRAAREPAN